MTSRRTSGKRCDSLSDRADLVIVTGGLGPTDNDITRETLRDFTGIPLREHPDVLAAMAKRFNVPPSELRANLRRQTQTPTKGTYLKNANGTAVGLVFETESDVIVALPGPPRELQPMVLDELVPYLSRRFGTRLPGASLTLRFVGLGQSQIDQTIKDHLTLPVDITTSSQFEGGRVDFTFSLPRDTPEERARLKELRDKILEHLGDNVYAEDDATSLETHVMKLIGGARRNAGPCGNRQRRRIGRGTQRSRGTQGSSSEPTSPPPRTGCGRCSAAANSPMKLRATARGAAGPRRGNRTGGNWAVAVGEAPARRQRRPLRGSRLSLPDGRLESRKIRLSGTGESARSRLVTELLDQLRRKLR